MTTLPLSSQLDATAVREAVQGCRRVLIKLPDGLLHLGTRIADLLAEEDVEAVVSADPCYGACDVQESAAALKVEKILFVGEAPMPSLAGCYPVPAAFVVVRSPHDIYEALRQALPLLEGTTVGLVSIAPYLHRLPETAEFLQNKGFNPVIGPRSRRTSSDGQVLGCDLTAGTSVAGRVDCFLYLGDGLFHPLGLALASGKPVVAADPSQNRALKQEIQDMKERVLKQRYAALARAMDARRLGIIVGTKLGQRRLNLAERLQNMAEGHGLHAHLIAVDMLSPARLGHLDVDAYVSTACPRVAIDDGTRFAKPLLTPIELEILVGERSWDDYEFDQIL
ncbi:MAG: diphthamide biosynthesis enzyme Dph2 [Candidatus Thermoplasmatota archaeon]|nr:diphthamide biosynthesis enzyme Dph2 [Candidatus Thermoplasmatota archaeon]